MQRELIRRTALVASMSVVLGSCAVSPQDCQFNQTATGALVGAGVGAAAGGIAAAASGMHTGAGLGIAAGAALAGAAIGAAIGHHNDQVCHQMAIQQALNQAMAANAVWQARESQRQADEAQFTATEQRQQQAHAQVSTTTHRQAAGRAPQPKPEYMTVAWANKMTNTTGAITPLSSVTAPASDQVCMEFNDAQTVDGQTKAVTGKACRGADGKWTPQ